MTSQIEQVNMHVATLEPDEKLEYMFVDYRAAPGEWADCKVCGNGVFRPQAFGIKDKPITCQKCGTIAFEVVPYAVRRRRLN